MYEDKPLIFDVLKHHGIKGQKWGVRRFQNKDGSLTSAGYKRYGETEPEEKKSSSSSDGTSGEKEGSTRSGKSNDVSTTESSNGQPAVDSDAGSSPDSPSPAKVSSEKTSSHHQKLVNGYLDKGMSQEDAEAAALRRARTQKIIAVTAALTIAAATAYVAKNHYDKRVAELLTSKDLINKLPGKEIKGVEDAFLSKFTTSSSSKFVTSSPGKTTVKSGNIFTSVKQGKNGEKIYNVTTINISKSKSSAITKIYNTPIKEIGTGSKQKKSRDNDQVGEFVQGFLRTALGSITSSSKRQRGKSSQVSSSQKRKVVSEYKKEHPGTELSDDEILANYYGSQS